MPCSLAHCTRKVVVLVALLASLAASSSTASAPATPAIGVELSSCLLLDEPKSPSAGGIAPLRDGGMVAGRVERMRSLVMGASCRTLGAHISGQEFAAPPRANSSDARTSSATHFSQVRVVTSSMTQAAPTTFETFGASPVRWTKSPAAATAPSLRDEGGNLSLGGSTSATATPSAGASMRMLGNALAPEATLGGALPAIEVGGGLSSGMPTSPAPMRALQPFATPALAPSGGASFGP
jgi:hypothetical protein